MNFIKIVVGFICVFALTAMSINAFSEDVDLTNYTTEQLNILSDRIKQEIKENHSLASKERDSLSDAVKAFVEAVFSQNDMSVSWAWIDYDYTREWEYATMQTHFDAKDANNKSTRYNMMAGAYLIGDAWNVCYLELNGEAVYDTRDQIPDPRLNPNADGAEFVTPEPTPSPTPIPIVVPTNTPKPDPDSDPVAYMRWFGVPEELLEGRNFMVLQRGDKGDEVKALQEDLILIGYMSGKADGDYGQKTEKAVKAYQEEYGLDETGIADIETQTLILMDVELETILNEDQEDEDDKEKGDNKEEAAASSLPETLQFGKLLSVTETGTNDIVVIKAKIEPSYSNKSTIDQNYYNIEYLAKNYGFSRYNNVQYWAVADMTDGSEQKVISFEVSKDAMKMLEQGKYPANKLGDVVTDLWIHPSLS